MKVQIDLSNIILKTPRLILRPWRESDVDDMYEYACVAGVGEMAGWKHHGSKDETIKILRMFIDEKNVFALEYRDNNKVIGSLGLHGSWAHEEKEYEHLKIQEIGYVLSKSYWGKGLTAEAVRTVIDYCFNEIGLDALTVCHFVDNYQSQRVIEKCGFKYVKNDIYYSKQLDKNFDEKQYILFKEYILKD